MTNFTKNEIAFLNQVINYDDREGQKADNFSNGGVEEAAEIFGGNLSSGKGLLSSLVQKQIGYMDEGLFWINNSKIDEVYDALGK